MQSERSMTPGGRLSYTLVKTWHYRCEDCDAEFVKGEGKSLQKIDGGTVELGRPDLALCTDSEDDA
jgi:hypothetical protein